MRTKHTLRYAIGIDASKYNTGIGILDMHTNKKTITTVSEKEVKEHIPKNMEKYEMLFIETQSDIIINEIKQEADLRKSIVTIENYAFGAKGKTFLLAEIAGILKNKLVFREGLAINNLYLCLIQHLKMFLTGVGNSSKDVILKEVYKKYNFDTTCNDKADAYVLMKISQALYNEDSCTKSQREMLKKVIQHNNHVPKPKKR